MIVLDRVAAAYQRTASFTQMQLGADIGSRRSYP
jgi:hypothetical protein